MSNISEQDRLKLLSLIHGILQDDPGKMYSKEEILNRLADLNRDSDLESLLGELEVRSSANETRAGIFAKCRGGTVYYRWNAP